MKVGRLERRYILHVPPAAKGRKGLPLVVFIPAGIGVVKEGVAATGFNELADKEGFLAAYPLPHEWGWNVGRGCCGKAFAKKVDDVAFVAALIDRLVREDGADPRRVFVAGQSTGGMLAYRLACERSGKVAAVASVAGTLMTKCAPSRPVPAMIIHGTSDAFVPWEGGPSKGHIGDKNIVFASVPFTHKAWLKIDGCGGEEKTAYHKDRDKDGKFTTCRSRSACEGGSEVVLCKVEGGGHSWPGGAPFMEISFGEQSRDFPASEQIWKFFQAHPMPAKGD